MWLSASNFVIPDLLSLTQLIVLFAGTSPTTGIYIFPLFFVNPCVEIMGVLLATVWAASNHWQTDRNESSAPTFSLGLGSRSYEANGFQESVRSRVRSSLRPELRRQSGCPNIEGQTEKIAAVELVNVV
jgi:hypothetical protein